MCSGTNTVPPSPGTVPKSVRPPWMLLPIARWWSQKIASSVAMMRSQAKARLEPKPMALPLTLAITGFSISMID